MKTIASVIGLASLVGIATAAAHDVPDLTRLPVGDGKLSQGPQRGAVWSCPLPPGGGGAFRSEEHTSELQSH